MTGLVAMAAALLAAPSARAQIGPADCSVASTPLMFGIYLGNRPTPTDLTAIVTVTCTARGSLAASVAFKVVAADGGNASRLMRSALGALRYQLFVDAAHSVPWGDGTAGTVALSGSGAVSPTLPLRQSFTLYGRVLARQTVVPAGAYQDSVPIRMNW